MVVLVSETTDKEQSNKSNSRHHLDTVSLGDNSRSKEEAYQDIKMELNRLSSQMEEWNLQQAQLHIQLNTLPGTFSSTHKEYKLAALHTAALAALRTAALATLCMAAALGMAAVSPYHHHAQTPAIVWFPKPTLHHPQEGGGPHTSPQPPPSQQVCAIRLIQDGDDPNAIAMTAAVFPARLKGNSIVEINPTSIKGLATYLGTVSIPTSTS
ncbi:MAG: hypothetical protein J3Q66DRAFT_401524 [Benniella sp.]|nr:MAG: hypothetical protein J3Q66DRAFT_401524 [Benniella sp.]